MAIDPHRIEAAYRVVDGYMLVVSKSDLEAILAAAFPELAAGTAWVAPMSPTEAMWKAGDGECNADEELEAVYSAMRDAHLSKGKDDDHG